MHRASVTGTVSRGWRRLAQRSCREAAPGPATAGTRDRAEFRPDIEGMRAVAIVAVLLAHAGLPVARGGYVGVDIFFVISGFLITRMLIGELDRSGTISLARFYSRRIRRLMPQALCVLAAVTFVSAAVFSPVRSATVSGDVVSASVYAINWRFSAQAVDYFEHPEPSPLAHFWSLAVEEQFYLVWPPLLLGVAWLARGRRYRVALGLTLATVAILSFLYALHATSRIPSQAYFSTPARIWELSIGGLLAIVLAARRAGPCLASACAWGGVGAIAAVVVLYDGTERFPGPLALVPTLGAAALVVAGSGPRTVVPVRALSLRPVQRIGNLSYAWYVWHWPCLIFVAAARGPLSPTEGALVIAASFIPTYLTNRWIEEPLRFATVHRRRPRLALVAAPAGVAFAVALALGLTSLVPLPPPLSAGEAVGASVIASQRGIQRSARAVRPAPQNANRDRPPVWEDGCAVQWDETRSPRCTYGDTRSKTTVVLFGDSHANQYFTAFERLAHKRHWRLVSLSKAGCTPADVDLISNHLGRQYAECLSWRRATLRRIAAERPRLVVVSSATYYTVLAGNERLRGEERRRALADGFAATLTRLTGIAPDVVAIRDAPRPPQDVPSCVSENMDRLRRCAFPERAAYDQPDHMDAAARSVPGVTVVDPRPLFCIRGTCPAVIGNVLVYRGAGHITDTYVATMTPWIAKRLPPIAVEDRRTGAPEDGRAAGGASGVRRRARRVVG